MNEELSFGVLVGGQNDGEVFAQSPKDHKEGRFLKLQPDVYEPFDLWVGQDPDITILSFWKEVSLTPAQAVDLLIRGYHK